MGLFQELVIKASLALYFDAYCGYFTVIPPADLPGVRNENA